MNTPRKPKLRLSRTSVMHGWKLAYRTALLLAATAVYLSNHLRQTGSLFGGYEDRPVILGLIWILFAGEMLLRFFPSRIESMGCQKKFARNYRPADPAAAAAPAPARPRSVLRVAAAWIALNAVLGALYGAGVLDEGILLLVSLAYSVCDMICILFFCPFQTWFMHNKCCGSCRIYNWDYAMMFTPLLFVNSLYARSLFAIALALLIEWEIVRARHPERFAEATNASLACVNCRERLCQHKRQLRRFLERRFRRDSGGVSAP